jgi:hypothetical protein
MKYPHYNALKKHKTFLEAYPKTRSHRDASNPEMQELAELREQITGRKPNMYCHTCIDEMLMDLVNYYNSAKADETASTKKEETKLSPQQKAALTRAAKAANVQK